MKRKWLSCNRCSGSSHQHVALRLLQSISTHLRGQKWCTTLETTVGNQMMKLQKSLLTVEHLF